MNYELTKTQKKLARQVIEKGLQLEFKYGLDKVEQLLHRWKSGITDNRAAWHELYNTVTKHDKHIASRYDNMTGSKYLLIIAGQLASGVITQEDLMLFDEEVKDKIIRISEIDL